MSNTQPNVRLSYVWLLPAAALSFCACYAEVPGSAPVDDSSNPLFPDGGSQGGLGGNPSGGGLAGALDTGLVDPVDAGTGDSDANLVTGCDGVAIGVVQTRKLYAEAQVVPPATCKSETQMRTCRNTGWSAWSGTYKSETCMQAAVHSCGDVAHGATETRERYPSASVNDVALCVAEEQTRECDDGTFGPWSGSNTADTCEVSFLGRCSVLSDIECAATSTCTFKLTGSLCLGATAHTCSANAECVSGVCVNGSCTAAKVPSGGTCDEAADCAACSGSIAASCNASNVCACGNGAVCSNNNQCQGSCVTNRCVTANTTCDTEDDCTSATSKCVKPSPGAAGTCLFKDGQTCTTNTQCEHVCRTPDNDETFVQRICQPRGTADAHCDENVDCTNAFVCRPFVGQSASLNGAGTHCQVLGQSLESCDETADCAQTVQTTCTSVSGTLVCFPVNTGGTGGNQGGGGGGNPGGN
jgi:hypothetical protein